ncbi:phosphotransferase enzyme family protein [Nonomuraea aridisoli]|uniref:Aminoglycoside phosphotransferase family protein n=1 Tax=Nonomuraea aridisoli TaxID=2070368 RepID=A0A2W2DVL5_9ACTN|nr:aminoglycoside phosphotransferase family protein [Nonomuraea aridisoli]PZG15882.1 aminoglycoside phosphotransferase family protein [Nonomuraea aridisoli]
MTTTPTPQGFGEQDAHRALVAACEHAGLDSRGAVPMRLGENALYRLASAPVVVRIARSVNLLSDVRKEVAVARWLEAAAFPSVRLFSDCPQATIHDGRVVTFWRHLDSGGPAPSFADLAVMLRRLHDVPKPVDLVLPLFDPLARVEDRLDCASTVADEDLEFLRQRVKDLYAEYNSLDFPLPAGHIHGDGHKNNLLRRSDGQVILLDFEAFAWGPREWDLCTGWGIPFRGFRWVSREEYARAVDAYGFDVTEWPGFHTIRRIRETTMTSWLMQNVDHSPEIRAEFDRRVASLRHDVLPRVWRPF